MTPLTERQRALIFNLTKRGYCIPEIARLTGHSLSTISKYVAVWHALRWSATAQNRRSRKKRGAQ